MKQIIQLGESVRLYLTYNDADTGVSVDPLSLTCTVRNPDGTLTVIPYPSTDFVREGPGEYFVRVLPTMIGTHAYRMLADIGTSDKDVRDGKFDVEPSL